LGVRNITEKDHPERMNGPGNPPYDFFNKFRIYGWPYLAGCKERPNFCPIIAENSDRVKKYGEA
jgi:hypothetical protein